MLYEFLYPLHNLFSVFNVFRYITFRTAYSILTALIISFMLGPMLIKWLKRFQIGETIRDDGPQSHKVKEGTPTMGGLLIIIAILIPVLLWADLKNPYIWLTVFSILSFGLIGFADDYMKVILKYKNGMKASHKLIVQIIAALIIGTVLYLDPLDTRFTSAIGIPFLKDSAYNIGWIYIPFVVLVIVGTSNAVNLTDGLDGLAIGPVIIATTAYMVIAYVTGHKNFSDYLHILYINGCGELTVVCGAIVGASLGFLWFNSYPAELFMGNTGSLALGASLGTVAVISKHELLLIAIGGIFVIEAMSVIIQVLYFKCSGGKRVFNMAPLHHHFEIKGWEEPKVIVRFWIIAIILALLSLSTLKLR